MDQTVRTVEGIFLRSVRSTCGNGLRYICHLRDAVQALRSNIVEVEVGELVRLKAYVKLFQ